MGLTSRWKKSGAQNDDEALPVRLRWKLVPGEELQSTMTATQEQSMDEESQVFSTQIFEATWKVEAANDNQFQIQWRANRLRRKAVTQVLGEEIVEAFDSSQDEISELRQGELYFKEILQNPFRCQMNARGNITRVTLPVPVLREIEKHPYPELSSNYPSVDQTKQFVTSGMFALPEEPVSTGDQWERTHETRVELDVAGPR